MDDIRAKIIFTDAGASAALGKVTAAATATGAATKTAGANIGQFGSTIGLAGQAVGKLSPALGGVVSMAGSATGSLQAMATLGLGPVGIAIAGISLAVNIGAQAWSAYAAAQDTARAKARDLNEELQKTADAFDSITAARNRQSSQMARDDRLRAGEGTTSEYRTLEQQRSQQMAILARAGQEDSARFQELNQDRLLAQQQLTPEGMARRRQAGIAGQIARGREAGAGDTPARRRSGGGGGGGGGGAQPSLDDLMQGRGAGAADGMEGLDLSERQGFQFNGAGPNKDAEGDGMQRGMELDQTLLESQVEREKAASESLKDIYKDTFGTLQEGIAASANAMINGGASAEQAGLMIVAALANQLSKVAMMEGLKEAALAAASFASYDYPGAAMHLAAAGAWTLVGAAAGVAGGALSAAAQPSGAGPSTGAGPAPRQQTAAEEGARNITVNFAGGVITAATEAQLARVIRRTVSNTALGAT